MLIKMMSSVEIDTFLTGWFVANRKFSSKGSYTNFPDKCVWDKTDRKWKERVKRHGTVIARVYSAHPVGGDRFYLRLLLNHLTGCTSYQVIRTSLLAPCVISLNKQHVDEARYKMIRNLMIAVQKLL